MNKDVTPEQARIDLEAELEVAEIDFKTDTLIHYAKGRISGFDFATLIYKAREKKLIDLLKSNSHASFCQCKTCTVIAEFVE